MGGGGFFVLPPALEARENVRVLILREGTRWQVSGSGLRLKDLGTGRSFFQNKKYSRLTFERRSGSRVFVKEHSRSGPSFLLAASAGFLSVNGRRYRGSLRICPGQNGDLWVVNELPLEAYLTGLINGEISSGWPLEAVKAQAVAARTYALYQKSRRSAGLYDLDAGVLDQVYGGAGLEDERARRAVRETEREVLLYGGEPIFAVYHACCGGRTESPQHLWPGDFPYLKSTDCGFCLDSPHFLWNWRVDGAVLRRVLSGAGVLCPPTLGIELGRRSDSRRVLELVLQTEAGRLEIPGKDFRRILGYDVLRSTNFVLKEAEGVYFFSGLGWGHGVGLCQWGARGMAEAGRDYRSILKHYYPGAEIGKRD